MTVVRDVADLAVGDEIEIDFFDDEMTAIVCVTYTGRGFADVESGPSAWRLTNAKGLGFLIADNELVVAARRLEQ
jgi:hypothetical protein